MRRLRYLSNHFLLLFHTPDVTTLIQATFLSLNDRVYFLTSYSDTIYPVVGARALTPKHYFGAGLCYCLLKNLFNCVAN